MWTPEALEGVAGVPTPALIERGGRGRIPYLRRRVLPGFRPRLSLNARPGQGSPTRCRRVLPGFRPRLSLNDGQPFCYREDERIVLPGFRPRLSLNVLRLQHASARRRVCCRGSDPGSH